MSTYNKTAYVIMSLYVTRTRCPCMCIDCRISCCAAVLPVYSPMLTCPLDSSHPQTCKHAQGKAE